VLRPLLTETDVLQIDPEASGAMLVDETILGIVVEEARQDLVQTHHPPGTPGASAQAYVCCRIVVWQALSNARKYRREGTPIEVRVAYSADELTLTVRNINKLGMRPRLTRSTHFDCTWCTWCTLLTDARARCVLQACARSAKPSASPPSCLVRRHGSHSACTQNGGGGGGARTLHCIQCALLTDDSCTMRVLQVRRRACPLRPLTAWASTASASASPL
jgi:hypothetical protein